jgi:hypothetical protein
VCLHALTLLICPHSHPLLCLPVATSYTMWSSTWLRAWCSSLAGGGRLQGWWFWQVTMQIVSCLWGCDRPWLHHHGQKGQGLPLALVVSGWCDGVGCFISAGVWVWGWVRVRVWVVLHSLALRGLLGCTDDHTYIIVYGGCGAVGLPWVHVTLVHTSSHFSPFLPFFSSSLPHGDCKMAIGSSFTVVQSFTSGWWLNKMVKLVCSLFL